MLFRSPPPVEEDAGAADAGTKVATGGGGASGPCAGSCTGTAGGDLASAVRGAAGGARGCYERALRQNSGLQGRLTVRLRVDPGGTVCGASIGRDEIHAAEVSSCVLGIFRGRKFPAPQGGCVDMDVPLSFTPKDAK